ncbi:MAG: hypothetical protein RL095_2378 [Verrucomicrobiota bacterium]
MHNAALRLALILAAAVPALATEAPAAVAVQAAAPELIDAQAAFAAARKADLKSHPDAAVVYVDEVTRVQYRKDGTDLNQSEQFIKILTEEGRRDCSTFGFSNNVFYADFAVLRLEIWKADGEVIRLDPAQCVKEQVDNSSRAENIYDPNDKRITAALPGLEIGDCVRILTRTDGKKPRVLGKFSDMCGFENDAPILRQRYEVSGPAEMPLKSVKVLNEIPGSIVRREEKRDGATWQIWEGRDIPQLMPEPGMPEPFSCIQRLAISTAADWKEISRWYWELCAPNMATTPAISAKAKELIQGATSDEEKIRRIFRFVSQEIRYMGVMDEAKAPGYEPHKVSLTFDNRYGVCRDKAALLVTMLREAGFQAFPVIIMSGPKLPKDVPMPMFNHAITAVEIGGQYQLMDSTDESTRDLLPNYLQDASFLVARPEGETILVSPTVAATESIAQARTEGAIAADGSLEASTTWDFSGLNDKMLRGSFAEARPDQIRAGVERRLKSLLPGASLTSLELSPKDMQDISQPVRLKVSYKLPGALVAAGQQNFVQLPWVGGAFAIAAQLSEGNFGLEKRRFPVHTAYPCGLRESFAIRLPAGSTSALSLPAAAKVDLADLGFQRQVELKDGVLSGSSELMMKTTEIPVARYAAVRQALADIADSSRRQPILAASAAETGSEILEQNEKTILSEDGRSWVKTVKMRRKILNYAGKKANGDLSIDFNSGWEEVKVKRAAVIAADGSVTEAGAKEINLMDQDWNSSAPRYPAGKSLVVSLPKLEIGSIIETEIEFTSKNRLGFSDAFALIGFDPCHKAEFSLAAPADVKLKQRNSIDQLAVSAKDGNQVLVATGSWSALKAEKGIAPASTFAETLEVSTLTHASLAKQVSDAIAALGQGDDSVKAKAAEILKPKLAMNITAPTDREKIIALRNFVALQIRGAGPGLAELPLSALSRPEVTLKDGYGNQADRMILLAALLAAQGIEAKFLLAASDPAAQLEADKPLRANTYDLLVLQLKDGTILSDLNQYSELGTTSLEGCLALGLDGQPQSIAVLKNRDESRCSIKVAADGSAEVTLSQSFPGASFAGFRRAFEDMSPEERRRFHQEQLAALAPDAVAGGEMELDLNYPGKLSYIAKLPRFAVVSGDYLYFDLPQAEKSLFSAAGGDGRVTPFLQGGIVRKKLTWDLHLPSGYQLASDLPRLNWEGPGALGKVSVGHGPGTGDIDLSNPRFPERITQTIQLNPAIVPAASQPALSELDKRLGNPGLWRVLLKKSK